MQPGRIEMKVFRKSGVRFLNLLTELSSANHQRSDICEGLPAWGWKGLLGEGFSRYRQPGTIDMALGPPQSIPSPLRPSGRASAAGSFAVARIILPPGMGAQGTS